MYELNQVGENTFYIECPAKIGIYRVTETEVYLIDSGNNVDAGKKILKVLTQNHWNLLGILITHSNADHIGGAQYLQKNTNCKVFAYGIEEAFTKYPLLEPSFLYGGYPMKDLRSKFLLANESNTVSIEEDSFPKQIEVIHLPGHFFHMIGFKTPDHIVFLADCINSQEIMDKYGITFIYDINEYINTLNYIQTIDASLFIPSHTKVMESITKLAKSNLQKVDEIKNVILEVLKTPMIFEELLSRLFERYQLFMTPEQYVLVGSTVRSYLSWLKDQGMISFLFENNKMLWKSIV